MAKDREINYISEAGDDLIGTGAIDAPYYTLSGAYVGTSAGATLVISSGVVPIVSGYTTGYIIEGRTVVGSPRTVLKVGDGHNLFMDGCDVKNLHIVGDTLASTLTFANRFTIDGLTVGVMGTLDLYSSFVGRLCNSIINCEVINSDALINYYIYNNVFNRSVTINNASNADVHMDRNKFCNTVTFVTTGNGSFTNNNVSGNVTLTNIPIFQGNYINGTVTGAPTISINNEQWAKNTSIVTISGEITSINADLLTTSGNILIVSGLAQTIIDNLATTSGNLTTISGDILTLSNNLYTVSGNLTTVSGSILSLSNNLATTSGNLTVISGDILSLTNNIVTISGNLTTVSGDINSLNNQYYYVSEDGNDVTGNGRIENPLLSVLEAWNQSYPGATIVLAKGGVYGDVGFHPTISDRRLISNGGYFVSEAGGHTLTLSNVECDNITIHQDSEASAVLCLISGTRLTNCFINGNADFRIGNGAGVSGVVVKNCEITVDEFTQWGAMVDCSFNRNKIILGEGDITFDNVENKRVIFSENDVTAKPTATHQILGNVLITRNRIIGDTAFTTAGASGYMDCWISGVVTNEPVAGMNNDAWNNVDSFAYVSGVLVTISGMLATVSGDIATLDIGTEFISGVIVAVSGIVTIISGDVTVMRDIHTNLLEYDFTVTPAKLYIWNDGEAARAYSWDIYKTDGASKPSVPSEVAVRKNFTVI